MLQDVFERWLVLLVERLRGEFVLRLLRMLRILLLLIVLHQLVDVAELLLA